MEKHKTPPSFRFPSSQEKLAVFCQSIIWLLVSQLLYKFYRFKAEKPKSATQLGACGRRWRNPKRSGRPLSWQDHVDSWAVDLLQALKWRPEINTLETGRGKTTQGLWSGKMLKSCFGKNPHALPRGGIRSRREERKGLGTFLGSYFSLSWGCFGL